MRPKGKVVYRSDVKNNPNVQAALAWAKAKAEESKKRAEVRANTLVVNWKCYPMVFVVGKNIDAQGNWLGGLLPKCRVCQALLPPREHHTCPGFVPKYVDHDAAWRDKQQARREAIRETRRLRVITCSVCGEVMEDESDGAWHAEDHGGRPLRENSNDEDDPSGYEDYVEGDYVEGDEDGYDCE
jgi:hypothetical protein